MDIGLGIITTIGGISVASAFIQIILKTVMKYDEALFLEFITKTGLIITCGTLFAKALKTLKILG